jgi:transcriptional regulator with XRE-family HTH domain
MIDRDWIKAQMAAKNLNQKKLGMILGLDSGATSRLLSGQRACQLGEAAELALVFEEPLDEILVRFGLIADSKKMNLNLSGFIGNDGKLQTVSEAISIPPPPSAIGKLGCVQLRCAGVLDKAIAFYGDDQQVVTDRLALLLLPDNSVVLGCAYKGYIPKQYKIKTLMGQEFESEIVSCRLIADIAPI